MYDYYYLYPYCVNAFVGEKQNYCRIFLNNNTLDTPCPILCLAWDGSCRIFTRSIEYPAPRKSASAEIEGGSRAMEQSPDGMPLPVLKYRCAQEISNYHHGKLSDERYCLEIFRRALADDDNDSWIALQEQFRANVVFWLRRHSTSQEALQIENEQNYVDDTFKRF